MVARVFWHRGPGWWYSDDMGVTRTEFGDVLWEIAPDGKRYRWVIRSKGALPEPPPASFFLERVEGEPPRPWEKG